MIYAWIKAAHVASMTAWLGGMLANTVLIAALGRARRPLDPSASALAAGLRGWDRRVTVPAMLLTWAFGITLAAMGGWFASGWLPIKLALVLALSALHGVQVGQMRRLTYGAGMTTPRPGRGMLGAAILAAVTAIAVLVVIKPI